MSVIANLRQHLMTYQETALGYAGITREAAVAEAEYRRIRAQRMAKATISEGASAAKAEILADADDAVAAACLRYKVGASVAEATRARLAQLREQVASDRSELAYEREADKFHAAGFAGGA